MLGTALKQSTRQILLFFPSLRLGKLEDKESSNLPKIIESVGRRAETAAMVVCVQCLFLEPIYRAPVYLLPVWPFCQCCTQTPLPSGSVLWEFLAPLAPTLLNTSHSPFLFSCCIMLIFMCIDSECISCCTVGTRNITRNECTRDFSLRSVALHKGVAEKVDAWSPINNEIAKCGEQTYNLSLWQS